MSGRVAQKGASLKGFERLNNTEECGGHLSEILTPKRDPEHPCPSTCSSAFHSLPETRNLQPAGTPIPSWFLGKAVELVKCQLDLF
ncbi:unnamed protein product, partial [Gulo gulo]